MFLHGFPQYGQTMFSHRLRKWCGSNLRSRNSLQSFSAEETMFSYISFASLAHPCTLCSATKYRQSCGTCKTSIVESASPQLVLLLRNIVSPFLGGKRMFLGFLILEKYILPFLERCSTLFQYRSLVVCILHAAKKNTTCVARKHATSRISHSIQSFSSSAILCFSKYLALFSKTKLVVLFLETNTYLFPIS